MQGKVNLNLNGVPKTLLLPLVGRAKFSEKMFSPIRDEQAIKLLKNLNYDFTSLKKDPAVMTFYWVCRAYQFDRAIKGFLLKYPTATIVNLGAGLDTTFSRVDNGLLNWINLDLPEVMSLRQQLLPPNNRQHNISKSILDFTWFDDIKSYGQHIFFYAGGLFIYFDEGAIKSLFSKMAVEFPDAELMFDTIPKKGLKRANEMVSNADMKNAVLKWAIDNPKEIESWSSHLKLQASFSFYDNIPRAKLPFKIRSQIWLADLFHKTGMVHLRFV